MNPAAAKSLASLLVSILSFLGWSTSDYAEYLPKDIKSQISFSTSIETIATSKKQSAPSSPSKPKTIKKISPLLIPVPTPKPKVFVPAPVPMPHAPKPAPLPNPIVTPIIPPTPPPQAEAPATNLSFEEKINRSTVNILCKMQKGNQIEQFTGSGVVIDPSGVIITNAHVAEHVMLAESGYESCNIRTGSPAHNSYKAKVIYLPDAWIQNNKNNLQMQTLTGTGENDYALLVITERTVASAPNVPLPYIPLSDKSPTSGDAITLAGYPAGFGDSSLLDSALYLLQKPSQVKSALGFSGNGADVIDTSATSLAVRGSSGGAIVGSDGNLLGIMDSVVTDNFSGGNAIQGISIMYIKNSIQNNLGKSMQSLIDNAQSEAGNFERNKVQTLSTILMQ